ncbi:MAG: LemA family protein [Prevotellaceae bacterium]|jgi:LemA protein|nr:LemA family protein [Prevotellaceae bacterium]
MKKSLIILLSVVGIIAILVIWALTTYNKLVTMDEAVPAQWAQVESAYKRRADLIPNLVSTVKGYASHESETFAAVTAARATATQLKVDANNLTPEKLQEYQQAQGQLSSALGRLLMVQERYPDLKANQNFLDLQAQLEGTENRINTERMRYNEVCREFNSIIRRFPGMLFGFEKRVYFEATDAEKETPKVEF